jgi:hypothetical protein
MDAPSRMTLTEYALRRGVSKMAVSKAVSSGRLVQSVTRDENGRPWVVDPELADREWARNTNLQQAPVYVRVREEARVQAPAEPTPAVRDPSRGGRPPKARAPEPPRGEGAQAAGEGPPGDGRPQPVSGGGLNENNAVKAYWQALHEQLDYLKAAGKLVPAAAVDAKVRNTFTVTRTKLLTLPSRAKTLLGLNAAQVLKLEALTRELLEELADGRTA